MIHKRIHTNSSRRRIVDITEIPKTDEAANNILDGSSKEEGVESRVPHDGLSDHGS